MISNMDNDSTVRYYKEQQHHYMVIRLNEKVDETQYQYRMLCIRKPKNILQLTIRNIDGVTYGYYDITSCISIKQLYGNRYLDMDDISKIMDGIRVACEALDRYLLDADRIKLDPEMIFFSMNKNEYFFTYMLVEEANKGSESVSPLLDYLLEKVNPEDTKATEYVYQVYEYYERGNFDVWDAIELLPIENGETTIKEDEVKEEKYERKATPEESSTFLDDSIDYLDSISIDADDHRVNYGVYFGVIGLGGIGIVACSILFFLMDLSDTEMMVLIAGFVSSLLIIGIGASLLVKQNLNNRDEKEYEESIRLYVEDAMESRDAKVDQSICVEDFMAGDVRRVSRTTREDLGSKTDGNRDNDEGQTVFFEPAAGSEYKLYAMDKKNKQHISLDKLPIIIGKMPNFSDCVLDHPSISRVHAKLERKDGELTLEDLNSTNGVYLNGIRLLPNESRIIEPGDEIRLGKLNYCLRTVG